VTRLPCCQEETLGVIFRDGVRMALNETTLVRKFVMLNIVCGVSLLTIPIMGYRWLAEKMDGGK
jgi:hypothetical protein